MRPRGEKGADGPASGSARGIVRDIDRELSRLDRSERALTRERALLLGARAALNGGPPQPVPRPRVSQIELIKYVGKHPGRSAEQIAEALQVRPVSVSTSLHRGRHNRYERRDDGWHVRPPPA